MNERTAIRPFIALLSIGKYGNGTTPLLGTNKKTVRITHPFSPDKGKEFTLIDRKNFWGDERLILINEKGKRKRFNASWTDYEPPTLFREISAGRAYLSDVKALELAELLHRLMDNVK